MHGIGVICRFRFVSGAGCERGLMRGHGHGHGRGEL